MTPKQKELMAGIAEGFALALKDFNEVAADPTTFGRITHRGMVLGRDHEFTVDGEPIVMSINVGKGKAPPNA